MKRLILFVFVMMGWMVQGYAQSASDTERESTATQNPEAITYTYEAPHFYINEGINAFDRLRFIMGFGGIHSSGTPHLGSVEIADTTHLSRFQLILDEYGNVEDCTLVKSAQYSKDKNKKVESFLLNNRVFDGPGYLNGKPCKSVILLTVRYYENGDVHMNRKACYPLILLPDSDEATDAPADSSVTN